MGSCCGKCSHMITEVRAVWNELPVSGCCCKEPEQPAELREVPSGPICVQHQETLFEEISSLGGDMSRLHQATPDTFRQTFLSILSRRGAPMMVLSVADLSRRGVLSRPEELAEVIVQYEELDLQCDRVMFVSHRWWRPGSPNEDALRKLAIVLQQAKTLAARLPPGGQLYIWWDHFSIDHLDLAKKFGQIKAVPFYLCAADFFLMLRGGDEAYYFATPEERVSHPGFYDHRLWTMLEIYAFTSDLALHCEALRSVVSEPSEAMRPVREAERFDVSSAGEAAEDARLLIEVCLEHTRGALAVSAVDSVNRLRQSRERLHDSPTWSLPPTCNLSNQEDLEALAPVAIALVSSPIFFKSARISTRDAGQTLLCELLCSAARLGLEDAYKSLLPSLTPRVGAAGGVNAHDRMGYTALMHAVLRRKEDMVHALIQLGASAETLHPRLGTSALQMAVVMQHEPIVFTLLDTVDASQSLPVDQHGRSLLHLVASRGAPSLAEAAELDKRRRLLVEILRRKVDPIARDSSGRTPIDIALAHDDFSLVALMEDLISDAQRAFCFPRTIVRNSMSLPKPSANATAVVMEKGLFELPAGWAYAYEVFAPAAVGSPSTNVQVLPDHRTAGLRMAHAAAPGAVVVARDYHDNASFCTLLCAELGMVVYRIDAWPEKMPRATMQLTMALAAAHVGDFIEQVVDAPVEAVIAFDRYCEVFARVAAKHPEVVNRVILFAASALPPEERDGTIKSMLCRMECDADSLVDCIYSASPPAVKESTEWRTAHAQAAAYIKEKFRWSKILGIAAERQMPAFNSPHWPNWEQVAQPALVVGGLDDVAENLAGLEHAIALLPNSIPAFYPGAAHMPQLECLQRVLPDVVAFIREPLLNELALSQASLDTLRTQHSRPRARWRMLRSLTVLGTRTRIGCRNKDDGGFETVALRRHTTIAEE